MTFCIKQNNQENNPLQHSHSKFDNTVFKCHKEQNEMLKFILILISPNSIQTHVISHLTKPITLIQYDTPAQIRQIRKILSSSPSPHTHTREKDRIEVLQQNDKPNRVWKTIHPHNRQNRQTFKWPQGYRGCKTRGETHFDELRDCLFDVCE